MRRLYLALRRLNLALFLSLDRVATYLRGRRRSGESGGAAFVEFREAVFLFEISVVFYLMRINARLAAGLDSIVGPRRSETG